MASGGESIRQPPNSILLFLYNCVQAALVKPHRPGLRDAALNDYRPIN